MVVRTKNRFVGFLQGVFQFFAVVIAVAAVVLLYLNYFSDWKVYRNKALGIEFSYPREMQLIEKQGRVTLLHQIPYRNNGGCDMTGEEKIYEALTDFEMSFEVALANEPREFDYVDGKYSAGILEGEYQYLGAEGCGFSSYYFPLPAPLENRQLIVRRTSIQILSEVRANTEEREEILSIPGAISKQKNDELFKQILSSFKVISK